MARRLNAHPGPRVFLPHAGWLQAFKLQKTAGAIEKDLETCREIGLL